MLAKGRRAAHTVQNLDMYERSVRIKTLTPRYSQLMFRSIIEKCCRSEVVRVLHSAEFD